MTKINIEGIVELEILEDEYPEPDYPSYRDEGRILFEIYHIYRCNKQSYGRTEYEIEILDYDVDSSVFYLQEGVGIEYYLEHMLGIELDEIGFYVLEGVHGEYIRGDGWVTDDDEEWYCGNLRRATEEEIRNKSLS